MSHPLRVLLAGGDGYCPFFGTELRLREVTRPWFSGSLPDRGEALLFQVEDGAFAGTHIALTSRLTTPLLTQLKNGYASVVVHHIKNPTSTFGAGDNDPCGMSFVNVFKGDEAP